MAVTISQTAAPTAGTEAASGNVAVYDNGGAGFSIGTAASDRIVVVAVGTELSSSGPTACTIDVGPGEGQQTMVAGTLATEGAVNARLFYLHVPTGTVATFRVTFGSTNPTETQNLIAIYKVVGANPVPITISGVNDTDADPITTGAVTVPAGGSKIVGYAAAADATARTWTGVNKDLDTDAGAFRFSTGFLNSAGGGSITTTVSGGNNEDAALSYFVFSPGTIIVPAQGNVALSSTAPSVVQGIVKSPTTAQLSLAAVDFEFLLHADGADGSTTFVDSGGGHTITLNGDVQIDTAQSKFGGASALFDGTTDWLELDGSSDFAFGTGDFTVDFWVRPASVASTAVLYDPRPASTQGIYPLIAFLNGNTPILHVNGSVVISGDSISADQWYHIAVTRASGTTKLFVNGTQNGSDYADTNDYICGANRPRIASGNDGGEHLNGWIDEFRVIKGTAAWTSNFTPPTAAYGNSPTVTIEAAGTNISPAQGNLALSSVAPSVDISHFRFPAQGNLTLSTVAPSVVQDTRVDPAQANLALSTTAPSVDEAHFRFPAQGNLTLSTVAPSVSVDIRRDPAQGDLVLSTFAPSVTVAAPNIDISPAQANLTLTATAPSLDLGIAPAQGNLSLTTVAPSVTVDIRKDPAQANLELTTVAPTVHVDLTLTPAQGNLTLSTVAPTVSQDIRRDPAAANLTLTTFEPEVANGDVVSKSPATADLALSATAPLVTVDFRFDPATGNLALSTDAPTVSQDFRLSPAQADLALSTTAPTVEEAEAVEEEEGPARGGASYLTPEELARIRRYWDDLDEAQNAPRRKRKRVEARFADTIERAYLKVHGLLPQKEPEAEVSVEIKAHVVPSRAYILEHSQEIVEELERVAAAVSQARTTSEQLDALKLIEQRIGIQEEIYRRERLRRLAIEAEEADEEDIELLLLGAD